MTRKTNDLQGFENPELETVRVINIDGMPWFVGQDVAQILGYSYGKSMNNAVASKVDEEYRGSTELMTPRENQNVIVINESRKNR